MRIYRISERIDQTQFENLREELLEKYPGLDFFVYEQPEKIYISHIKVPKEMRGSGIGTEVVNRVKEIAAGRNKPVVLHPEAERGYKKKLDDFYKRLDFVENKGRNRDYSLSDPFARTMYWKPKEALSKVFIEKGSQEMEDIKIEREKLSDRVRYVLRDRFQQIGKITVQDFGDEYYHITAFYISPPYRREGWSRRMIEKVLEDNDLNDRDIVVRPYPYAGDEKSMEDIVAMYRYFGFTDAEEEDLKKMNYLIYKR